LRFKVGVIVKMKIILYVVPIVLWAHQRKDLAWSLSQPRMMLASC